ncbi:hypothetical protein FFWV33_11680 [Flavobacterium faecale]|uniref:Uncharacterized protein n=1 Tax=Flavobacterium faecale TaxID=1355330 RepID=A0A2S1LED2_9FLAO|nr:hypothetical protein [Flavobacterium faecale]AWG22123.1 hypothetical protein FFWV33_11680 [Flavobacterium faecale]
MTENELRTIIENKKLPKDELDNLGDNVMGYLPLLLLLLVAKDNIPALLIVLILIFYTFYCKIHERDLIAIPFQNTNAVALLEITKIAEREQWTVKFQDLFVGEYYIPFVFGQPSHKLTVILTEEVLFVNVRNIGTSKGRFPYLFGTDTICKNKVIRLIENHFESH